MATRPPNCGGNLGILWLRLRDPHEADQRLVIAALADQGIAQSDHCLEVVRVLEHDASKDWFGQLVVTHLGVHPPDPEPRLGVPRVLSGELLKRVEGLLVLPLTGKLDRLLLSETLTGLCVAGRQQ